MDEQTQDNYEQMVEGDRTYYWPQPSFWQRMLNWFMSTNPIPSPPNPRPLPKARPDYGCNMSGYKFKSALEAKQADRLTQIAGVLSVDIPEQDKLERISSLSKFTIMKDQPEYTPQSADLLAINHLLSMNIPHQDKLELIAILTKGY